MTRVAVIGCGHWGPNLARNFHALEDCELRAICDLDPTRVRAMQRIMPGLRGETDYRAILAAPDVDAVAVCTPASTHFEIASAALRADKHVLVEKPMTDSVATAEILVDLAESRGLTLQVDDTPVYGSAVQRIREMVDAGQLGAPLYADCARVNLGIFQSDVNVIWDLASHDVSVLTHLIDLEPQWVSATGSALYGPLESQAYVTIQYQPSLIAHIHVSWLAPVKRRSMVLGGSKNTIVYDDLEPVEKVRVYERGISLNADAGSRSRARVETRAGDVFAPSVEATEPLAAVCRSFVSAVRGGARPPTDGRAGLAVVRVLDAAHRSLRDEGERVRLDGDTFRLPAQQGTAAPLSAAGAGRPKWAPPRG